MMEVAVSVATAIVLIGLGLFIAVGLLTTVAVLGARFWSYVHRRQSENSPEDRW
jgi:hypothetical protein